MAVLISGVLKDGVGKPVQGCTIQLKAKRTTATVIVHTVASECPDNAGHYSMDVEPGRYSVTLCAEGFPPAHAGEIVVREDSAAGTLNDFLDVVAEDDVRPEAIKHFEAMVAEVSRQAVEVSADKTQAAESAKVADVSAGAAAVSDKNAADSAGKSAESAQAAAQSGTAASNSAKQAQASQRAAELSATRAGESEKAATASRQAADLSAQSASAAALTATEKAREAVTAGDNATRQATDAGARAEQAITSAQNAKSSEDAAGTSASAAADAGKAAVESAQAASVSEVAAIQSAKNAETYSAAAQKSAENAGKAGDEAGRSATEAGGYRDEARELLNGLVPDVPEGETLYVRKHGEWVVYNPASPGDDGGAGAGILTLNPDGAGILETPVLMDGQKKRWVRMWGTVDYSKTVPTGRTYWRATLPLRLSLMLTASVSYWVGLPDSVSLNDNKAGTPLFPRRDVSYISGVLENNNRSPCFVIWQCEGIL